MEKKQHFVVDESHFVLQYYRSLSTFLSMDNSEMTYFLFILPLKNIQTFF